MAPAVERIRLVSTTSPADLWRRIVRQDYRDSFADCNPESTHEDRMKLFELPDFLQDIVGRETYVRWLQRKAAAHIRRDRKRGNENGSVAEYKRAIHQAVCKSKGFDVYTREKLDWHLVSTYNNDESKQGKRSYKAKFALLPTVDHLGDGTGPADFAICGWRTNDAKGDLTLEEFVALCRRVMAAQMPCQHD